MLVWGKAREGETSGLVIFDNDASMRARAEDVSIIEIEYIRATIDYH
jgi:hypothetical protein